MNARLKLGIFLGAIVAVIFIGINFVRHLFGGYRQFSGGPVGFRSGGMMGQGGMMRARSGFGSHVMMYGPHHGGFHVFGCLLFLLIAAAIIIFVLKRLRRNTKGSSMQQFIDTSITSSHTPVSSMNGSILDQWEKSVTKEKENEKDGNF